MSTFILAPKGKKCQFTGFETDCCKLVAEGTCDNWTHIEGHHPLTGQPMNEWGCAFKYAWVFGAEAAKNSHNARAETFDLRNMIFDPAYRAKKLKEDREKVHALAGASEVKQIEG